MSSGLSPARILCPLSGVRGDSLDLEKIEYIRERKPPTLKQFVWRKAVSEASAEARKLGLKGNTTNPDTGLLIPRSALHVKEALEGKTPEDLIREHPGWVAEYDKQRS